MEGQNRLIISLEHGDVVHPRSGNFLFNNVLKLLDGHLNAMAAFVEELRPWLNSQWLKEIPEKQVNDSDPYWSNGYFSEDDARVACALVHSQKPATIIEIGSGNSTRFFRKAISEAGTGTRIISIDPEPRSEIVRIADSVFRQSVLDVEKSLFSGLEPNDILFLDGSHLVFNGTDTTHFFLEILPILKPGVLVHIHDVMLPNEYSEEFTRRGYNEQYLLATLLLFSKEWQPLIPVHYLTQRGVLTRGGVSFWIRKAEPF